MTGWWPHLAYARRAVVIAAVVLTLGACAGIESTTWAPSTRPISADEGRALIRRGLPNGVSDPAGWATDIYAALAALEVPPSADNVCAVIGVIGQESGFQIDPVVPGLAAIARKEIEARREKAGIPKLALDAALGARSSNGKTYGERLDTVRTEQQLSQLYEDFIARVPFGRTLLADRNPIRTAGPMQVSVAFAEAFAGENPYPYPVGDTIRHELFTRRGGVYFGTAHLLAYPASYPSALYRFADYNAGHYASRNAAFQRAVTQLSGIPLSLDGDLLRYDNGKPSRDPGSTELAVRVLGRRIGLGDDAIRRDLLREKEPGFERTPLYGRVFELADAAAANGRAPRAVMPQLQLQSPKITRQLTTDWFARRVETRQRACLDRLNPP